MIHIAIISHGHEELLISSNLGGLLDAGSQFAIWVKDNKPSESLKTFCLSHDVFYTDEQPGLGFGHNNNFLHERIEKQHGFAQGDSFVVMNPDITVMPDIILQLVAQMRKDHYPVATLNLYRDVNFSEVDTNIRRFPDWTSIGKMIVARSVSGTYKKHHITRPCHVDWASGAFLVFDSGHYAALRGFEQSYFMYFEDVDLCYRSHLLLGQGVRYYPYLKAIHKAARRNRNLASKHALWFIHSFLKFLARRYFIYGQVTQNSSEK